MNKTFISHQIKGKGRARTLGFPTINLEYLDNFDLRTGVYGVWAYIDGKKYIGAMQYGDSPTFKDKTKTLEIYLIDFDSEIVVSDKNIKVDVIKYLRPVIKFDSKGELIRQIEEDIKKIKSLST